ncbi:flagellar basal body rod protein FlgF [Citrobacter sp. wls619]|uniref:flagellar basal body rod protein FlgF n=1 Tax=Citrobacter sp. wls619 TaxID=2576432 RepID=UPI0010C95F62|nr:flagellar basal body rod protein FlgF [Citrobacter sp. wls619]TKV07874.1 flagellar basal body rod protein FlgF [Citrobacter sp. wls619]
MDRVIYTAMSAANAALNRQTITANNMANSTTAGFRAQLAAFRTVPVEGETLRTRALVVESTPFSDNSLGPITHTGRNLDVALPQNGFLAVALPDGNEGYTRNGNIEVDQEGRMSVNGNFLMGDGAPLVAPPNSHLTVAEDGSITALGAGDEPTSSVLVGRLKMVNAQIEALVRTDDGLFRPIGGGTLPLDDGLLLSPESLEGSNVSPVKSMAEMIANARGFEMNMKVIRTADENAQKANQLFSVS